MSKVKTTEKASSIDILGIEESKQMIKYSIEADQPIGLEGPPGVGKSAIVMSVANEIGLSFEPLILSLCDPTDIGGFPVASNGAVDRLPLGSIKRACKEPVMLFLDELTCASPAVQGAAMRLVYERWAGDVKLNPGTRIVTAYNPPDQAAGGWELALPLLGRMTKIRMRPKLDEIQNYFYALGDQESEIRKLAVDLAATLEMAPDLMQIDPPAGAASAGTPWGAPRSWERAVRVCARIIESGGTDNSVMFAAALSGNIGDNQAASFMTIRKVRAQLPSIDEVSKNPKAAKLPFDVNSQIAVLGILAQVAIKNPCPAWIYAERLTDEVRVASMNMLGKFPMKPHEKSPMFAQARTAQAAMFSKFGNALRASSK